MLKFEGCLANGSLLMPLAQLSKIIIQARSCNTSNAEPGVQCAHLNLLTITATINITKTVIIATVTILLVAILRIVSAICTCLVFSPKTWKIPSGHASQCLITPVRISFALEQCTSRVLDRLSLPAEICERISADLLRVIRYPLSVS